MKDPLDRLTPLGLVVLALLDEGDMHPYEMIRLMRQRRDDRLVAITNGTVYHTVGRLEEAGLVEQVGTDREGNRPERTTYRVTAAGRDAVGEWVRRELVRTDHPAEFRIALAEAHNVERSEVVQLLKARRTALAESHRLVQEGLGDARGRGIPEQFLLESDREETLLAVELQWLDGLIRRLEDDDVPWGAPHTLRHSDHYLLDRKAARL